MGTVWHGRDVADGTEVAVKLIEESDPARTARFRREAELLAALSHPGIVRYVSHGHSSSGTPFLVMEWLEGEDLGARLRRGPLPIAEVLVLGRHVAEALSAAHGVGVVHRDIKPENLFLDGGSVSRVKVVDFGVARLPGDGTALTRPGAILGTLGYMAPEQARGQDSVDARADIFSLGCVLWTCLAGRPLFDGQHVAAILAKILFEEAPRVATVCPEVSAALDDLIARMLSKDPAERPRDATAVAAAIAAIDRAAASAPAAPVPLEEEQRFLSVIFANGGPPGTGGDPARLQTIAARFDARMEPLADRTVACVIGPVGSASDMATRAAHCALEMSRESGLAIVLATERATLRGPVHAGRVIDAAARLLHLAVPGRVLVDPTTTALVESRFEVDALEAGGALLRARSRGTEGARRILGRPTRCLGRDRELANLEAILDECFSEARARAVLVIGAAGIGKSRVRQELRRRMIDRAPDAEVWTTLGDPMRAGSPFGLAADLLAQVMGIAHGEAEADQHAKIRARVERHHQGAEAARIAAFLGELAGAPLPADQHPLLRSARQDPKVLAQLMGEAFDDWLAAETCSRPVLLMFDDVHLGDGPSLALIDAALRRCADRRFLVIGFARPDVRELFPDLWQRRDLEVMTLRELPQATCERLAREVLEAAPPEVIRQLAERSGGNAFLLEELIRGAVAGEAGDYPPTVLAMVESRMERLGRAERRVLRSASVLGEAFWIEALAALLGVARNGPLEAWLESLLAEEWVVRQRTSRFAGHKEFRFRHALLREAAYGTLTEADRGTCHRRAALWLEQVREGDALVLAEHWRLGEVPGRAVASYLRAAEQALEASDFGAAVARAAAGLSCGATGEMLGRLYLIEAEAYNWRAEHEAGARRARDALSLLPRGTALWAHAIAQAAWGAYDLGQYGALEALASELLSSCPADLTLPHVLALGSTASHLVGMGTMALARRVIDVLVSSSRHLTENAPLAAAWTFDAVGFEAYGRGDLSETLDGWEKATEAFEQGGDRRNALRVRLNIEAVRAEFGAARPALLQQVFDGIERLGSEYTLGQAYLVQGRVLEASGAIEQGLLFFEKSAAWFRSSKCEQGVGEALTHLARLRCEVGDLQGAERDSGEATRRLAADPQYLPAALAVRARILSMLGDVRGGIELVEGAVRLLGEGKGLIAEPLVGLVHAELLDAAGDLPRAREVIGRACDRLLERAARVTDPELRAAFLGRVEVNARVQALARAWADDRSGERGGAAEAPPMLADGLAPSAPPSE